MQARKGGLRAAFFLVALCSAPVQAGAEPAVVVRCPGPPVLYTSNLSAAEALARGCERLHAPPVTVGGAIPSRAPAVPSVLPGPSQSPRVSPETQRLRDTDARTILQAELSRELERRDALQRTARDTAQKTSPADLARQAEALQRVEADIDAIRRELQRLR